jgi:hypothetical protein
MNTFWIIVGIAMIVVLGAVLVLMGLGYIITEDLAGAGELEEGDG